VKGGPSQAALIWAERIEIDASPVHVDVLLLDYINEFHKNDSRLPDELLIIWRVRFSSALRNLIRSERSKRRHPPFVFNSATEEYIQGYCFTEPNDSPETIESKNKRSRQLSYLSFIERLTPAEFEKFCGALLNLWKCTDVSVSASSGDQGLDFYGKIPLGKFLKNTILPDSAEEHMFAWVVGQAKKYNLTKISTSELRELVGSVQLARSKAFSNSSDPLSGLNVLICDPVIYLMATTGSMTSGCYNVLEKSGIIGLDGIQLSTILADNDVALLNGKADWNEFYKWMAY